LKSLRDSLTTPAPPWKSAKLALYCNVRKTLSHVFAPGTASWENIAILRLSRPIGLAIVTLSLIALPSTVAAQTAHDASPRSSYWRPFALGFAGSILAHESAHILTAYALGAHPHLGLDRGRPTIFSGIDSDREPHKQFLFSASGLTTQDVINEAILDIPHTRGAPLERGILAGGIATTLFYITLGRNASVSDISFMARTSSLSKTQLSLIFGGISAIHAIRMAHDSSYSHFFIRPSAIGTAIGYEL
jgi:hypothetical protein